MAHSPQASFVWPAILAATLVSGSCSPKGQGAFWTGPGSYEVSLMGSGEQPLRDTTGKADTLVVLVHVDSIARDSLFGSYESDFRRVGLMVGRASPGPQYVVGRISGGASSLELTPDATDAGLLLEGKVAGRAMHGTWHTEAHGRSGLFTLRPRQ